MGEVDVHVLDVPVNEIRVEALLSKLSWLTIAYSINDVSSLSTPIAESKVLKALVKIKDSSISCLVS